MNILQFFVQYLSSLPKTIKSGFGSKLSQPACTIITNGDDPLKLCEQTPHSSPQLYKENNSKSTANEIFNWDALQEGAYKFFDSLRC